MAQRVTLRKRNPYNTTSNKRRIVKTPGGRLVYHHIKKNAASPKCGDCGIALPGVRAYWAFLTLLSLSNTFLVSMSSHQHSLLRGILEVSNFD
jgi:hypothetical protein